MKLFIRLILTSSILIIINLHFTLGFQHLKIPKTTTTTTSSSSTINNYHKYSKSRLPPLFGTNLTEITKDNLLKNAQQLRLTADLLEKETTKSQNETDSSFISTYAIKSAPIRDPKNINNITMTPSLSRNESLLFKNAVIVEERSIKSDLVSEREKKIKSLYDDIDGLKVEAVDSYMRTVIESEKQTARTNLIIKLREQFTKSEVTADTINEVIGLLHYFQETVRSLEPDDGDGYLRNIASIIEVCLFVFTLS